MERHWYFIRLADGREKWVDISDECDWGNVQGCTPDDCEDWKDAVGWGNDEDGRTRIVEVRDEDGNEMDVGEWARMVWNCAEAFNG